MTDTSPFAAKRYEHAGSHVYYIPPAAFQLLETAIPTYLVGTRGTGKTTLLRALSWDERLYNLSLGRQLKGHAFEKKYLGLYFKLPNVQLELLDRWLDGETDADYAAIMAFYLDLCWLETTKTALKHLDASGVIAISKANEDSFLEAFNEIWELYPACAEMFGDPGGSIQDVLGLMHPMRRGLERLARRKESPLEILDKFPIGQIGSFGRQVGRLLAQSFDEEQIGGPPSWSFRICMDEGEVLGLRQQRVINSMIRLTEWPVFYLIAYVSRPQDATGTFLPNQTLQHADRQIMIRDDMTDRDFRYLSEGIVNVRIRNILEGSATLNTNQLLGKLNIDGLLRQILSDSESQEIQDLLTEAREIGNDGETPPIYETYLRRHRPELTGVDAANAFTRRKLSSSSIRKQMVAAYLSICREASSRPMYASADMVFQVSDKCVRDFLWIMESIFQGSGLDLSDFLSTEIPVREQDAAMRQAAELKMTFFRERVLSAPAEANQFVDGLARITALIQSTGRNYEQIRTPERGIFTYNSSSARPGAAGVQNAALIRDAAEAGFLRLLEDEDSDELRFRVHASLAPNYGFSYRGAYYSAGELTNADILALRHATTAATMNSAVSSIVNRITGRRSPKVPANQPPLI